MPNGDTTGNDKPEDEPKPPPQHVQEAMKEWDEEAERRSKEQHGGT